MRKYLIAICAVVGLAGLAGHATAGELTSPVDGQSYYYYDYSSGVWQTVIGLTDPVLHGVAKYPWYKERACPVFEFQMDTGLYGQSDLEATFDFYVTQAGSDTDDDGIQLRYAQGNGVVEYADAGGALITTVDPMVTGWRSIDVSPALQAAADGDWAWLRLTLYPDDWYSGDDEIYVASSENTGYEPSIQIAPEPTSAMLACAAAGLILTRRRR